MIARRGLSWTLVAVLASPAIARAESVDDAGPMVDAALIESHLAAGRLGQAVSLCESAASDAPRFDAAGLREPCGRASLALGDRFAALGQTKLARTRWEQALAWDLALADDPEVLARLAKLGPASAPAEDATSDVPTTPTPLAQRDDAQPDRDPDTDTADTAAPPGVADDSPFVGGTTSPTPRAEGRLIVGLGAGYLDGVLGLVLGWQLDPQIALQMSMGILYQTFDVRMRFLALREALTPFIGFGLLMPLTPKDRVGLGLASVEAIYELAESFHVDVGITWMATAGLELNAGVSFVTPFDQVHPDTVVFFPQLTGGVSWIF